MDGGRIKCRKGEIRDRRKGMMGAHNCRKKSRRSSRSRSLRGGVRGGVNMSKNYVTTHHADGSKSIALGQYYLKSAKYGLDDFYKVSWVYTDRSFIVSRGRYSLHITQHEAHNGEVIGLPNMRGASFGVGY